MKLKFLRWYVIAFRLFVPVSSFLWTSKLILDINLFSNKFDEFLIEIVFVLYLGTYLLMWSERDKL